MKKGFIAIIGMFFLMVWPLGGLWSMLITPIVGGSIEQSFLYPLYIGIILLAGIIVGATTIICKKIDGLEKKLDLLCKHSEEEEDN